MNAPTESDVSPPSTDVHQQSTRTRSLSSSPHKTWSSAPLATLSPQQEELLLDELAEPAIQDTSRPPSRSSVGPDVPPRHLRNHTRQRSVGAGAAIKRRLSATLESLTVGLGGYSSDQGVLAGGRGGVHAENPSQRMAKADVKVYRDGIAGYRSKSSSNLLASLPHPEEEANGQSGQQGSPLPGGPKAERRRATTSEGSPGTFDKVKYASKTAPSVSSIASSSSSYDKHGSTASQRFSTFLSSRFLTSATGSASTSMIPTRNSLTQGNQEQSTDLPRSTSSPAATSLSSLSIHDFPSSTKSESRIRRSMSHRRADTPGGEAHASRRSVLTSSRRHRAAPSNRPSEDDVTRLPSREPVEKPFHPNVSPAAMEVSEFAKWGGPVSDVGGVGFDGGPGSSGRGSGRAKYPATAAEKDAFFEPLSHAQRSFVAIDGTTESALCAAGVGSDAGRYGAKKRVRQGIGERVVGAQEMGNGGEMGGVIVELPYVVGFERDVMDLEAMLHESYREVAGGRHTFYPKAKPPPAKVLDIGTGIGLWPIAMAQEWPDSTFVGFDLVPVQVDLATLAKGHAARRAKMKVAFPTDDTEATLSSQQAEIDYTAVNGRVQWELGNFLHPLPFDAGTFDFVHIRFCGLGVPETKWLGLLEEATRVLKRGTGVLEIVETTYTLPQSAAVSRRFSYETLLRAAFIHPLPFTQIRPALAMSGLHAKQVLEETFHRRPTEDEKFDASFVFTRSMDVWVDSALGKRQRARMKAMTTRQGDVFAEMATRNDHDNQSTRRDESKTTGDDVVLTAWICEKR